MTLIERPPSLPEYPHVPRGQSVYICLPQTAPAPDPPVSSGLTTSPLSRVLGMLSPSLFPGALCLYTVGSLRRHSRRVKPAPAEHRRLLSPAAARRRRASATTTLWYDPTGVLWPPPAVSAVSVRLRPPADRRSEPVGSDEQRRDRVPKPSRPTASDGRSRLTAATHSKEGPADGTDLWGGLRWCGTRCCLCPRYWWPVCQNCPVLVLFFYCLRIVWPLICWSLGCDKLNRFMTLSRIFAYLRVSRIFAYHVSSRIF